MADIKAIAAELVALTVQEVIDLKNELKETYGIEPAAAAVVSDAIVAPTNTPWFQSLAWYTRGAVFALLPPNTIAEIGTPSGFSNSLEIQGQLIAGAVNLELG